MSPVAKIISGGQTGADRAGLDAALALGIPIGGWAPKNYRAEDGCIPQRYLIHLQQAPIHNYTARTELNVIEADATLIFTAGPMTPGSRTTKKWCQVHGRPFLHLDLSVPQDPCKVSAWLDSHRVNVLNVAGSRASCSPRIAALVEDFLRLVLSATKKDSPEGQLAFSFRQLTAGKISAPQLADVDALAGTYASAPAVTMPVLPSPSAAMSGGMGSSRPCWQWCSRRERAPQCHHGSRYGSSPAAPCLVCGVEVWPCDSMAPFCGYACAGVTAALRDGDPEAIRRALMAWCEHCGRDSREIEEWDERVAMRQFEGGATPAVAAIDATRAWIRGAV